MKLIIIDLKTDIEVELTNKETFNDINLNHKISLFNMEGQVIKTLEF